MAAIESTFASGSFLASLPSSCDTTPSGQLSLTTPARPMQPSFPYDGPGPWSQSAPLSGALKVVIGSPLFSVAPSLAGICAKILPLLTESYPPDGWNSLQTVLTCLHKVANNVENDWAQSALAGIENENDIGVWWSINSVLPLTLHTRIFQHPGLVKLPRISGPSLERSFSPLFCSLSPSSPPLPTLALCLPLRLLFGRDNHSHTYPLTRPWLC